MLKGVDNFSQELVFCYCQNNNSPNNPLPMILNFIPLKLLKLILNGKNRAIEKTKTVLKSHRHGEQLGNMAEPR